MLCTTIIDSCIGASERTIPVNRYASANREMSGWSETVEPERERSLFWHWIWLESGKPTRGVVYDGELDIDIIVLYAVAKKRIS